MGISDGSDDNNASDIDMKLCCIKCVIFFLAMI